MATDLASLVGDALREYHGYEPGDDTHEGEVELIVAVLGKHADLVDEWLATQRNGAFLSLPEGTTKHDAGMLMYRLLGQWEMVTHAQITKKGLHFGATIPNEEPEPDRGRGGADV